MGSRLSYGVDRDYAIAREVRGFTDDEFWEAAATGYLGAEPVSDAEREAYGRKRSAAEALAKEEAVRRFERDPRMMDIWAVLECLPGV